MSELKEQFQRALDRFGGLVRGVGADQWHLATPCTEWDVRDLVHHLVFENRWMPPLLGGGTIAEVGSSLDGDLMGSDPVGAWEESARGAGASVGETPLDRTVHLSYGDVPAQHYVFEVLNDLTIHGWDLARAVGADETMDPEVVPILFQHYAPMEPMLRELGSFGSHVDPPPGADLQTKLLAVFGRVA